MAETNGNYQEILALEEEMSGLETDYKKLEDRKFYLDEKEIAISNANDGSLTIEEMKELSDELDEINAEHDEIFEAMRLNLKRRNEINIRLGELGPVYKADLVPGTTNANTFNADAMFAKATKSFGAGESQAPSTSTKPGGRALGRSSQSPFGSQSHSLLFDSPAGRHSNSLDIVTPVITPDYKAPKTSQIFPLVDPDPGRPNNDAALPPLVRLDGQKLKGPDVRYPAMSYRENEHEAWPDWAIDRATKRYPDLPKWIDESRKLVPDRPEDLEDPDYFELPENPNLQDAWLHGQWKQKKYGQL